MKIVNDRVGINKFSLSSGVDVNQDREQQTKQVDAWIERTIKDLSSDQMGIVFCEAIQAVRKRALVTLSEVTLNAILDRAHSESQQKFPVLSQLRIEVEELTFDEALSGAEKRDAVKVKKAFRFFLIELLTIIENLTAGVLSNAIYSELSKVTASARPKSQTSQEDT